MAQGDVDLASRAGAKIFTFGSYRREGRGELAAKLMPFRSPRAQISCWFLHLMIGGSQEWQIVEGSSRGPSGLIKKGPLDIGDALLTWLTR